MTTKHDIYINYAKQEAEKSELVNRHGCVIVKDKKIIAYGHNTIANFYSHGRSIHAEVNALRNTRGFGNLNECDMYVIRLSRLDNELALSRPCKSCAKVINKSGLRRVYYSSDLGDVNKLYNESKYS